MEVLTSILFFIVGSCFGSFANVVIYRWPKQESVVKPRSRCPKCSTQIKAIHNLPIISWLFLRGKCAYCSAPISIRYPLIEALTGLIFVSIFITSGLTLTTLNMCIFTALAIPCFFIDLEHMYLPDIMTLPGLSLALVISIFNTNPDLTDAIIGVFFGGGVLWLLAYSYKKWRGVDGMGGGDIKLLGWLGALLGFQSIPFVLMFSSITGTLFGGYFLIFKNKDPKTFVIPFGPFLISAGYLFYFISFYRGTLV